MDVTVLKEWRFDIADQNWIVRLLAGDTRRPRFMELPSDLLKRLLRVLGCCTILLAYVRHRQLLSNSINRFRE